MSWLLFFFIHVFMLCLRSGFPHVASSFVQGGNQTDRLALLAFKAAITSDPFRNFDSWNESTHFCQWVGVTCGQRHQRVTVLRLDHQKLTGSISPHVGNLSFLRELSLRNNSLSHKIPKEFSHLGRLQKLSLLNNSITGEIPTNISSCSSLVGLEFTGNRLTGKIPSELGSLSMLKQLFIGGNNLTGVVPSTFGNLSFLTVFAAQFNSISGNIPDALGRLKKLEVLTLLSNKLVGNIPSSIFNISSLRVFTVGYNQIEGSLPSQLGNTLPNLELLEMGGNLLTGSIPTSVSNATKLYRLGFSLNKLTGKVPPLEKLNGLVTLALYGNHLGTGDSDDLSFLHSLTNATNLYGLDMSKNNFGGVLPESISNFSTDLGILTFYGNKIGGSIPTGIGNLMNLQGLDMSNNHLSGKVLADIGKLQKLQGLVLNDNKFYGGIPSSLGNLTSLTYLILSQNDLQGSIPSSLGKCHMLQQLRLDQNNLNGTIPKEVISISSLLSLDLSNNNLSGNLPEEIGILKNLQEFYVSENTLSGRITSTLGSCISLRSIHINDNTFWGTLPANLANLKGLDELDLSHNNFSGQIPDYLDSFIFLQKLDLSYNDFEGVVPQRGVFKNATAFSVKGNHKLCGGIAELDLRSCSFTTFRRKGLTVTGKLIVSLSFGLLGLLVMLYVVYLCWFRKTTKASPFKISGSSFQQLSYQSLLRATDGFSPANLVGAGSFGSVYKGILDQSAKVVAVKVLNLQFSGASKSFQAECKVLKNIKHRNLLRILTTCSSVDYQGSDFKALVYEFMANGSLEEWLHPNGNEDDAHEEPRSLKLIQRLNIAIDVASSIDYLHHHCMEPIVHCDLKPSNVLLNDEMIAHVGDFGLARFLLEDTRNSSANHSSSIGMRGSVGYAAPEYGMGNEASMSGDVYSYGILLLEMFTGKRPTDTMFTDSLTLHNFAKMAVPEQVESIHDPILFPQVQMGEASSSIINIHNQSSTSCHKIHECLISVFKIGITCSEEMSTDRMDMNEVANQLNEIKSTLLRSGVHGSRRSPIAV